MMSDEIRAGMAPGSDPLDGLSTEPNQSSESDDAYVRRITRSSKRHLVAIIQEDARHQGQAWALGGPEGWSHDELVSYVCRNDLDRA